MRIFKGNSCALLQLSQWIIGDMHLSFVFAAILCQALSIALRHL